MGTAKSTLLATLGLNKSLFDAGLKGALGAAKSFAGTFGSIMKNAVGTGLGFLGANVLTGMATGVTTALRDQVSKSIELSAGFEQISQSYKVLIGDASKAQSVVNKLIRFADITPFTPTEVTSAGKLLLAYGIDADKLIDKIGRLGDISSSVNRPLNEIAAIYGRASMQGKVFMRNIYQFQMRGIPIINAMAKALSKTEAGIMDMVKAGKIGPKELEAGINQVTNAGGRFFNMTIVQSRTTMGLWSTLTGYLELLHRAFGTPILPVLNEAMKTGIALIPRIAPQFAMLGQSIAGQLRLAFEAIVGMLTRTAGAAIEVFRRLTGIVAKMAMNAIAHVAVAVGWPLIYAGIQFGRNLVMQIGAFASTWQATIPALLAMAGETLKASLLDALAMVADAMTGIVDALTGMLGSSGLNGLLQRAVSSGSFPLASSGPASGGARSASAGPNAMSGSGMGAMPWDMRNVIPTLRNAGLRIVGALTKGGNQQGIPAGVSTAPVVVPSGASVGAVGAPGRSNAVAQALGAAADSARQAAAAQLMRIANVSTAASVAASRQQIDPADIIRQIPNLLMSAVPDRSGLGQDVAEFKRMLADLAAAGRKTIGDLLRTKEERPPEKRFGGVWGTSLDRGAYGLVRRRTQEQREWERLEAKRQRHGGQLSNRDAARYEKLEKGQREANDYLEGIEGKLDAILEAFG